MRTLCRAVLFDLDNTLIHFDESVFFRMYLPEVGKAFSDVLPFHRFSHKLLASTQALLDNDGSLTNAECFLRAFCDGMAIGRDETWKRFIAFYESEFHRFRTLVTVPEGVERVPPVLKRMGLKLVVASNPLWPMRVQRMRLAWAGLGDFPFDHVTAIENTRFCKPRLDYYREICDTIQEPPDACLMVGNDPVNDMVVSRIGMRTFLVRNGESGIDALGRLELSETLRKGGPTDTPEPDFTGTLEGLLAAVDSLR